MQAAVVFGRICTSKAVKGLSSGIVNIFFSDRTWSNSSRKGGDFGSTPAFPLCSFAFFVLIFQGLYLRLALSNCFWISKFVYFVLDSRPYKVAMCWIQIGIQRSRFFAFRQLLCAVVVRLQCLIAVLVFVAAAVIAVVVSTLLLSEALLRILNKEL